MAVAMDMAGAQHDQLQRSNLGVRADAAVGMDMAVAMDMAGAQCDQLQRSNLSVRAARPTGARTRCDQLQCSHGAAVGMDMA
eukprot:9899162-Karenia_brevis.AAC.1